MAGYSGTPLPRKLGIKAGARVGLANAPAGFAEVLGELPPGVMVSEVGRGVFDVLVSFVTDFAGLEAAFARLPKRLDPAGGLWIAWPKKAARLGTELDENVVREVGLQVGLVDNKVCAIDETWSGLRFVVRLADRPAKRA